MSTAGDADTGNENSVPASRAMTTEQKANDGAVEADVEHHLNQRPASVPQCLQVVDDTLLESDQAV